MTLLTPRMAVTLSLSLSLWDLDEDCWVDDTYTGGKRMTT